MPELAEGADHDASAPPGLVLEVTGGRSTSLRSGIVVNSAHQTPADSRHRRTASPSVSPKES